METMRIPLSQCVESSYQNRKELGDVSGLARSIEVNGQITPLIVVADGETYQLVAGHRRTAAMKSLGLDEADVECQHLFRQILNRQASFSELNR